MTAVKTLSVIGSLPLQPRLPRSENKSVQGGRALRNGRCRHAPTLPIMTPSRSWLARTGGRCEPETWKMVLKAAVVDSAQTSPIKRVFEEFGTKFNTKPLESYSSTVHGT